tara:strand:- start:5878 stop:6444 length:567 start_codon:yes stop_codon:yes gene_type:complete
MLTENIDNIDTNYVIISDPINNSIIPNSKYYKIIYSNNIFSLNGVFVDFHFKNSSINFKNNNIDINYKDNSILINKIKLLEKSLLDKFININKKPTYKLNDLLNTNCIKYNQIENYSVYSNNYYSDISYDNHCNNSYDNSIQNIFVNNSIDNYSNILENIVLKISGIWESNTSYGITFKFIFPKKYIL